jgi:hypothetical protein
MRSASSTPHSSKIQSRIYDELILILYDDKCFDNASSHTRIHSTSCIIFGTGATIA